MQGFSNIESKIFLLSNIEQNTKKHYYLGCKNLSLFLAPQKGEEYERDETNFQVGFSCRVNTSFSVKWKVKWPIDVVRNRTFI